MRRSIKLGIAGGAGLVVGVLGVAAATADPPEQDMPDPLMSETNQYGLVVGDLAEHGPKPDLLPVRAEDGRAAYVRYEDFVGPHDSGQLPTGPVTPDEAIAQMNDRYEFDADGNIYLTAYAADGRTPVGRVAVGHVDIASKRSAQP